MDINELISNTEKIDIIAMVDDAVHNTSTELVRLQRLQMLRGQNRKGFKIGVYKNKAYAIRKHLMNPLPGESFVDARLTGAFHAAIFADDRETYVVLDSSDEKTERLIEMYGEELFGLNDEHALEYSSEYLGPEITEIIKNLIHK